MFLIGLKKPPPPKTANEQAKRALGNIASTLGESFMVLHDDTSSSAKENLNLDYSVISLPTVNAQHLPHHQQQTLRNQPPRTDSKAAAPTPQSYQTSIIPFWSRPVTAVPPSVPASVPSSSNNPQSAIEGLDWNTQSFMTTNHYGTAAVHSHHLPQPPSQSHVGKDTSSYNLHDEATVQNLLDTISKLRMFILFFQSIPYSVIWLIRLFRVGKRAIIEPEQTSESRYGRISSCMLI